MQEAPYTRALALFICQRCPERVEKVYSPTDLNLTLR